MASSFVQDMCVCVCVCVCVCGFVQRATVDLVAVG